MNRKIGSNFQQNSSRLHISLVCILSVTRFRLNHRPQFQLHEMHSPNLSICGDTLNVFFYIKLKCYKQRKWETHRIYGDIERFYQLINIDTIVAAMRSAFEIFRKVLEDRAGNRCNQSLATGVQWTEQNCFHLHHNNNNYPRKKRQFENRLIADEKKNLELNIFSSINLFKRKKVESQHVVLIFRERKRIIKFFSHIFIPLKKTYFNQ